MKKTLLIFLLFCVSGIFAQVGFTEWATNFSQISNMTVCDMMQTSNGKFIVLVGYRTLKTQKNDPYTEGVVLVADAKTGQFLQQKSFKFRDQPFNSFLHIAEALNKTWLLVGASGTNPHARVGWIVRVKPTLEQVEEQQFGVGGDNFFEKIAQKPDGTWGFVGQRADEKGLLFIEYRTKWREITFKTPRLGDILTVSTDDRQWAITGTSENYGVWWSRLTNDSLVYKKARSVYKPDIKIADMSDGQLPCFFGTSWAKGGANMWRAQLDTTFDENSYKLTETLYPSKNEAVECAAVVNAQNGLYYVAVSTKKGNNGLWKNKILTFDGKDFDFTPPLSTDLDFTDNFSINGLTLGVDNTLWVWGQATEKDDVKIARVVKLEIPKSLKFNAKTKGGYDFENLFALKHELLEESLTPNNMLEPNETATILLNLTNISGQNISQISVQAQSPKWAGLDIELEENNQKLKQGRATLGFNISAKPHLAAGTVPIVFTVRINGQVRQELSVPLRCGAGTPVAAKSEVWYADANFNQGDRSKNASSSTIEIHAEARPNKPLPNPNAQPKVVIKKSNRAKQDLSIKPHAPYTNTRGGQTYPFQININLENGPNTLVIETDFGDTILTDTLHIFYNSKPLMTEPQRLHVIAIAPYYRDNPLDYNDNDIEDFVDRMKKQVGGLYSKVLIQKYLTYDSTGYTVIKKIFRDLTRRCASDYEGADAIGKRDVIIVFFSSHGKIIRNQFKIVPANFEETDEEEALETSVDYKKDILEKLEKIVADTTHDAARKILVFIDACHSGGAKSRNIINPELSNRLNTLNSAASGIITLSSTTEGLLSYEDKVWENGVFTEALLEALDNKMVTLFDGSGLKADTEEAGWGYLSVNEIFYFLQKRIPDLFLQHKYLKGFKQIPFMPTKKLDSSIPLFKVN